MTSTDLARISRRLPPLSGLLDSTLDEALRARRRRLMVADNPSMNLNALRVTDNTLDRLVAAAGLYGQEAADGLDARIGTLTGAAQEAAVFLRLAVAVHTGEPGLVDLIGRYLGGFSRAVRDACWFYPVANGPLSDKADHLLDLFEASADSISLRRFAIELAGLRDERRLRDPLRALLDDPDRAPAAHLALTRMGQATEATRRYLVHCMASGEPGALDAAMALIACDPRIADDDLIARALQDDPKSADPAWAIATCRSPRGALDLAATRPDLPDDLRARMVALAGYPVDIITACAAMARTEGPVTPAQADLLELTLGGVPAEARCEPNDAVAKSRALRALVLRACRQAHMGVRNDADIGPWEVNAILVNPAQAAKVRLRDGLALPAGVPALGRAVQEVSHGLRRWLYIERAVAAGHPFALSPFDLARRQDAVLMAAEFVDAMRAP